MVISSTSPVFAVGFGVFVVAMIVLAVLVVRWGVAQDRAARQRRAAADGEAASTDPAAGLAGGGHTVDDLPGGSAGDGQAEGDGPVPSHGR